MRRPGIPLFLARRPYRQRRRMDAARLLPLVGLFLVLLPIIWGPAPGDARSLSRDGIYLFAVWAGLILVARLLARGLVDPDPAAAPPSASTPAPDPSDRP